MTRQHLTRTLVLATLILSVRAFAAEAKVPLPATPRKQPDADWEKKHVEFSEVAKKGGIELLFMGDSITHGWESSGKQAWAKNFASSNVANFGIGGDRTEHILYRFQNGELDGISPKLIVLLIGTNNCASGHKPDDIALGIRAILDTVKSKSPQSKVLLISILPRADDPAKEAACTAVNALIQKFDDNGANVKFLDIRKSFMDGEKQNADAFAADHLHLSAKGYDVFAAVILPAIKQMLGH